MMIGERLEFSYLAGEKGRCFRPYHRTFASLSSLLGEIGHVSSIGMGGSSSSTHRVWKHTWRFATYDLSYQVVIIFCREFIIHSLGDQCRRPHKRHKRRIVSFSPATASSSCGCGLYL